MQRPHPIRTCRTIKQVAYLFTFVKFDKNIFCSTVRWNDYSTQPLLPFMWYCFVKRNSPLVQIRIIGPAHLKRCILTYINGKLKWFVTEDFVSLEFWKPILKPLNKNLSKTNKKPCGILGKQGVLKHIIVGKINTMQKNGLRDFLVAHKKSKGYVRQMCQHAWHGLFGNYEFPLILY